MAIKDLIFSHFYDSPIFTKKEIENVAKKYNTTKINLDTAIQRALKSREIVQLKRNHYVSGKFYEPNRTNIHYRYFLANSLLKPSYISRETALNYYGMLTEGIQNYYASVTTKLPRVFENNLGTFEYKNISEKKFSDYKVETFELSGNNYNFRIATKHKAVYDFIYYKLNPTQMKFEHIEEILEELRIDYSELSATEMNKLKKLMS